jgi:hypothetical protein
MWLDRVYVVVFEATVDAWNPTLCPFVCVSFFDSGVTT